MKLGNAKYSVSLKTPVFCLILLFSSLFMEAQTSEAYDIMNPPNHGVRLRAELLNGDTVPVVDLCSIDICTQFQFRTREQYELWTRTKYNVKIVYPYAIIAAAKLREYDYALQKIGDERLKKAFIKVCEKDLRHEFEDELKALTVSQGKILMKLIDREAGKTTYEVVKQLRGGFQATMWQTIAVIFGHDMKVRYDAKVEDIMVERAVKLVEAGRF
ncbi:MAG: DUF4294 domain-containing protein [bacterium]|nr:DUF4294 domain-containing protein [bacterium]